MLTNVSPVLASTAPLSYQIPATCYLPQITTNIFDSALLAVQLVAMATEIVCATYTEKRAVEDFLTSVFGEGNTTVKVRSCLVIF